MKYTCHLLVLAILAYFPLKALEDTPSGCEADCTTPLIFNHVNPITGAFTDRQQDLVLTGACPLVFERFYRSNDHTQGNICHSWNHNIGGNFFVKKKTRHYHGRLEEGPLNYLYKGAHKSRMTLADESRETLTNCGQGEISGRTNLKNNVFKKGEGRNFYLHKGDGSLSQYYAIFQNPYLPFRLRWTDTPSMYRFWYSYGGEKLDILELVHVYSKDEKTINSLRFCPPRRSQLKEYPKANHVGEQKKKPTFKVIAPDGRQVIYTLDYFHQENSDFDPDRYLITKVQRPNAPTEVYEYTAADSSSLEKVKRKSLPEGRFVEVSYYKGQRHDFQGGKVKEIKIPSGLTSVPQIFYSFQYRKHKDVGETLVRDAIGNLTIYQYDLDGKRLLAIKKYSSGNALYSQEKLVWGHGKEEGNLKAKVLEDGNGTIMACRFFEYDEKGNILSDKLFGNLTGGSTVEVKFDGVHCPIGGECYEKSFTYHEHKNLLKREQDFDTTHEFHYKPHTDLFVNQITKSHGTEVFTSFLYDDNGLMVEKNDNDKRIYRYTYTNHPYGLPLEELEFDLESGTETLISKNVHSYDLFGRLLEYENFAADGLKIRSHAWQYNVFGQVIKDYLEHEILTSYDANGNVVRESTPDLALEKIYTYDLNNRCIEEKISDHGKEICITSSYDTRGNLIKKATEEETTYFFYDEFNRVVERIHTQERSLPEVTRYSHDILGNVISQTDPGGGITTTKYTIWGKPYEITHPDGSQERFLYNLRGDLLEKISL